MSVTTTLPQVTVTTAIEANGGVSTTVDTAPTVQVTQEGGDIVITALQGQAGPAGVMGPQGEQGIQGSAGAGVATGGTTGQVLAKIDATNYNTHWVDVATGGGTWGSITGTLSAQTDLNTALSGKQSLDATLTALAGLSWSAGTQVPVMTAADTFSLKTVGSATGNLLDKAAGDSLYQPAGTYATGTGTASGTNTGDQTITLTGAVTGSGTGSFATTLASSVVALSNMANVATGSVFYRKTAATGAPEVQTLATLKTDLGLTGTNSGDQTITLTGDVTGTGSGSFATAIGSNKVTRGMLAATSAAGILGATAAGNVSDLTPTQVTALLNSFTSSLQGLAPASGGGTTNFLRADGTWAAPPTSGAGTTTNAVTFNNAGTGAASGTTFDGSVARTISYNTIGAQVAGSYQTLNSNLTAYAGANWSAGVQIPALTAANTIALKTVGSATGNILDKAAGDTLYQPVGTYASGTGSASGTNTGDQTITLTGDVTGSGTGSFAATIGTNKVGLSQMAQVATGTLFYRKTAATGNPEVQTLATLKTDLGLTGTNSGDQTITLTGDITGSGTGSFATAIGSNKVTRGMLAATPGATILGATAAGNVADLTAAQAKTFLAIASGDVSGLAAIATSGSGADLTANSVTLGKLATQADQTILGNNAGSTAAPTALTTSTVKTMLNLTGTNSGDQTITLTGAVTGSGTGSFATTLASSIVALSNMANVATGTVFYRKTAATGAPEVQTLATLKTDLGLTGTNSGDQTITLTGDITGSGTGSFATAIGSNKVTRGMLAATSAAGFLGATSATNVSDLTGTQATTLLDTFTSSLKGLAPASGGGTTNFLRADGTWAAPAGGGSTSSAMAWTPVTATGTGSSQGVTIPESGLAATDIMVFLNGILQIPTTNYTVSGTTVTLTTDASGDEIQIIKPGGTIVQGFSLGMSGKPSASQRAPATAPYSFTVSATTSKATALVAATASTVFTIKKGTVASPTTVGTFTFAAAGTVATVSITSSSITSGDVVWIEAPSSADSTCADITFLIRS